MLVLFYCDILHNIYKRKDDNDTCQINTDNDVFTIKPTYSFTISKSVSNVLITIDLLDKST